MKILILIIIGGCLGFFASHELGKLRNTVAAIDQNAPAGHLSRVTTVKTRFKPWSDLYGRDYVDYIANLRQISCPEETVSDIMFYTLLRAADAKLTPGAMVNPHTLADRTKEVEQAMRSAGLSVNSPPDFFLSQAELNLAKESLETYPLNSDDTNAAARQAMVVNFSAEQTVYYKSEFEEYGVTIEKALLGFRPTKEEYYAMVESMDTNSEQNLLQKLPGILTPDRYHEFLSYQNPVNVEVIAFCDEYPLLKPKRAELIQLLNQRLNLSVPEFRTRALDLVGAQAFPDFIALGQQNP
jgi:hypothetical protein